MAKMNRDTQKARRATRKALVYLMSLALAAGLTPGIALADDEYPDTDQPIVATSSDSPTVDVGNVTVDTKDADGKPIAGAVSQGNPGATLNVHGNVTVTGNDEANVVAVRAQSENSTAAVNVSENVTAIVDAKPVEGAPYDELDGVEAFALEPGANATVNVDGSVNAVIRGTSQSKETVITSYGVFQRADVGNQGQQATSSVSVKGNVLAEANNEAGQATGIDASATGVARTFTTVIGGVTARAATTTGVSIALNDESKDPFEDTEAIATFGTDGITATGVKDSLGMYVYTNGGTASVLVEGDVTATASNPEAYATGIEVGGPAGSSCIVVEGTVTGKSAGILTSSTESKADIIVWKVESDLVAAKFGGNSNSLFTEDKATEETIDYIIRIDPAQKDVLSLVTGTFVDKAIDAFGETRNYQVANWKNKVYLQVTEGLVILGGYSDKGKTVKLQHDENGWYVEVPNGGGVYLTAQVAKHYDVTFKNGNEVLQSGKVVEGQMPKYTGEVPTKNPTVEYTYEFAGWEPTVSPVTGDVVYVATFNEKAREYSMTFDLGGGTVEGQTGTYTVVAAYGSTITLPIPTREGYEFLYWEGSRYEGGASYLVGGDHCFKAVWREKAEPNPTPGQSSAPAKVEAGPKTASEAIPMTGDDTPVTLVVAILLASAAVVVLSRTRLQTARAQRTGKHAR